MSTDAPDPRLPDFDIFLATAPGLEDALRAEVLAGRYKAVKAVPGGVAVKGRWHDVWRANLEIRGASRVIATLATFRATHLAELDKSARRMNWGEVLRADVPVRVEATCSKSRIYHSGAAAERVGRAIAATVGCPLADDADVTVRARIERDVVTVGVDTSGELLHKRGFKEAVNKAPMRETMAALLLRSCGFKGDEPVVDPMCGSGTFVIEAAEMAAGLLPGRSRAFAFEKLATFDPDRWRAMRETAAARALTALPHGCHYYGSDRDEAAVAISRANAQRAGVCAFTTFQSRAISTLAAPAGPAGLAICNPPYGTRLGDSKALVPLYRSLGQVLRTRFSGWRVGIVTTEAALAKATGLPFLPPGPPIAHGGLRVTLYRTERLP